tara:strand:- start:97 stop:840 length:744 start_codon:yes stop_codon:yes gene_type:complete
MSHTPTACALLIGNEILSGRTIDKNLSEFGIRLDACGIRLKEVRVIPDEPQAIIEAVNHCRARFDYVFTTGGIGPTHDDITSACIAQAFNVPLILHPEAEALLRDFYGEKINAARLKMAEIPEGATLIANPVSIAPGFILENVYVLAGVPSIMRAMMDELKPILKGGAPMETIAFNLMMAEGDAAAQLTEIQATYHSLEIGIYPRILEGVLASHIVLRGNEPAVLQACYSACQEQFGAHQIEDVLTA